MRPWLIVSDLTDGEVRDRPGGSLTKSVINVSIFLKSRYLF